MLKGKHVLLGVTASIAAYKTANLVRLLIKSGADVQVIMTPSARDFVTPLTLSTLSKKPVYTEYFDGKTGEWNSHIELAEWADIFLIAPLSANTLAKMANGYCDNLLLATYLSARCDVYFAPAMDLEMYRQEVVADNIERLQSMGHILIPPGKGELASGLEGEGRMEEPEEILNQISDHKSHEGDFKGRKILISAGPTREMLDPVRFITNHSSGKMGLALSVEAHKRGAEVSLVHGPLNMKIPEFLNKTSVTSSDEMHKACLKEFKNADIIIMTAAVADFTPVTISDQKIKKSEDELTLEFKKTADILKDLGSKKEKNQFLVGFALETENEVENAYKKLLSKNLDLIVLNSLRDEGAGFGNDTNKIKIIDRDKKITEFALKNKREVARDILNHIAKASV